MRTRRFYILALALLATTTWASTPPAEDLGARIDTYLAPFVAAGHFSGSLLVTRGGKVLYERSAGLANRELGVSVDATTRFCIASVTKPMTQIIAFRLFEEGTLAPSDSLSKWIPGFPRAKDMTVAMLLQHRAGIPHRVTDERQESVPTTATEMVELAAQATLLFEPGSDSTYSSAGYSVLARVLEMASGETFESLLEKHVFDPAGMTHSQHPTGHVLIPNRASSYQFAGNGELVNSPLKHYSFLVGAGSIFSTARDLTHLLEAVVSGKMGEQARTNLLDDEGIDWNGRTSGYRSFADYHAESGVSIALVSNVLTGAGDLLRRDLPRIVAGEEVEAPPIPRHRSVVVDPARLARYVGDYELRPGTTLTLAIEGDEVRMSGWLLVPTSDTTFFSPQDYGEIEVVIAEDGEVERLDWTVAGRTYPMPRRTKP